MKTQHEKLAILWAKFNGMNATDKQVNKIINQLTIDTLERMLTQRNIKY